MSRYGLTAGLLSGIVLLFSLASSPPPPDIVHSDAVREGEKAARTLPPSDTLDASTTLGTPLIHSLPPEWNGMPVSRYVLLEGPALSGVAGRSFTWIPKNAEPGTYDVRLQARYPDAPADTLVLQIDVQP